MNFTDTVQKLEKILQGSNQREERSKGAQDYAGQVILALEKPEVMQTVAIEDRLKALSLAKRAMPQFCVPHNSALKLEAAFLMAPGTTDELDSEYVMDSALDVTYALYESYQHQARLAMQDERNGILLHKEAVNLEVDKDDARGVMELHKRAHSWEESAARNQTSADHLKDRAREIASFTAGLVLAQDALRDDYYEATHRLETGNKLLGMDYLLTREDRHSLQDMVLEFAGDPQLMIASTMKYDTAVVVIGSADKGSTRLEAGQVLLRQSLTEMTGCGSEGHMHVHKLLKELQASPQPTLKQAAETESHHFSRGWQFLRAVGLEGVAGAVISLGQKLAEELNRGNVPPGPDFRI